MLAITSKLIIHNHAFRDMLKFSSSRVIENRFVGAQINISPRIHEQNCQFALQPPPFFHIPLIQKRTIHHRKKHNLIIKTAAVWQRFV